ncbi:LOW QUALITY PROTEIN: uncharacterized protein LOC112552975, partial [Pogonomyrmex barbatus]|uniref:LOW QUALITY PROTEIN: uncharacterized protein LOC112552975 n=1 Tax=Pogonomyrmex barbatus TaxID=144034 RepID=A0A8N1SB91_9HYME
MYTDSLIYHIQCDDVYETMKRDIARFDMSDYPPGNAYGMPLVNIKVPSLMKDENNGAIMIEFVGLRAKMYAVRVDGRKDIKKVKGVKNNVVTRTITFNDYTRCLNEEIEMTRRQSCIRSKLHQVHGVRVENRSESVRRQTIHRIEVDGDVTVETLADSIVI